MNTKLKTTSPIVFIVLGTLAVWAWSSWVVQPRIATRYQEKSNAALLAANIIDANGNVLDLTHWLKQEPPEDLTAKRDLLNDARLYLRRLIDVSPDVNQLLLQLAAAAEASAQVHSRLASQAAQDGDEKLVESYRRKAFSDAELAQDTMVRLSRQDNAQGQAAKAWELARTLRSPVRSRERIDQLVVDALGVLQKAPSDRVGLARLGQLKTLQAFSIDGSDSAEARSRLIQEAVGLLSKIDSPSMVEQSFLAEAQDALLPEQAIQTSIKASQGLLGVQANERQSPEEVASLFGCLVRLGSLQEAQSTVISRLSSLSPSDQQICRALCSDYCVRRIACESNFPSTIRPLTSVDLLILGTHLDSQSPTIVKLLERLVIQRKDDALCPLLLNQLKNEKYSAFHQLLSAVQGAIENDWNGSRSAVQQSFQQDSRLLPAVVSLIGQLVNSQQISIDTATQFLDNAMEISQSDPNLGFTSAIFFEKQSKLEKAADYLEKTLAKTGNEPQILAFLSKIYARLGRRDDQKRIQLEMQNARKRN